MTPDWTRVVCKDCDGTGWAPPERDDAKQCPKCGGHGRRVTEIGGEVIMPELKVIATWLLKYKTIIGGIAVGGLMWITTGDSSAFWSAVASGLVAHGGATAGANGAIAAHFAKRAS
jgi:hypothetical protein